MKLINKITLLVAMVAGLASCHGQEDDTVVEVKLNASALTIVADGQQSVTFEVLYGANVVNAEAQVYLTSHPDMGWSGYEFQTTEPGEYIFQAIYRDQPSNEVTIVAEAPAAPHVSRFERHICVMDLTGTWCTFCPDGMNKLNFYVQKKEWKDIVHILALHDNSEGDDPMGIPLTSRLMSVFGNYGYPAFITDLRDSGSLSTNVGDIVPSFNRSLDEYPAQCGIKLSSQLNDRELSVDVTLFAELAGNYAVDVFLLEDGIVAPQKDGSVTHEDFVHKHVVRALINSDYHGDSVGKLAAEQEFTKTYTYTLPAEWKVENMSIVALAITADGYVNNVAACALGSSADYNYIAE